MGEVVALLLKSDNRFKATKSNDQPEGGHHG